jgi:hypothetical protein
MHMSSHIPPSLHVRRIHHRRPAACSSLSATETLKGEAQEAERRVFSIRRILDQGGLDYIRDAISLTREEFLELYQIVKPSMEQKGRG